jgi:hypothetical protein
MKTIKIHKKSLLLVAEFWRRAAKNSKTLKVGNEVIREKAEVTQTVVERTENNTWKRYGHV